MADIYDFVRKALEYQRDELDRELRSQGKRLVFIHVTDAEKYGNELQEIEDSVDIVKTTLVDEGTCMIVNKSACDIKSVFHSGGSEDEI